MSSKRSNSAKRKTPVPVAGAWRHWVVVGFFAASVLGLCARVVYLGVTEKEFLQQQGDARSVRREIIPAMRGVIYDQTLHRVGCARV